MSREFFNSSASTWDEKVAEKDARKLEAMVARMDIKPGSTILDVGTGTGILVPFIQREIGRKGQLVCLDYAEEMLNKAEVKGFRGDIRYICADIEDSQLPGDSFDYVVCYSSFPHFEHKSRALDEIRRLLRSGGRLFICHTSSRQAINDIHGQIPEVRSHLIPEEDEMRNLLSTAGFSEISIFEDKDSYFISAVKSA
jgi:ubiquinone/menaquinone biosynthesis C-methylase UbiE